MLALTRHVLTASLGTNAPGIARSAPVETIYHLHAQVRFDMHQKTPVRRPALHVAIPVDSLPKRS
jgi:hypothetical protein